MSLPFFLLVTLLGADDPTTAKDNFGDPLPAGAVARLGTVRFRLGGSVEAVIYSPDGKLIAAAGGNGRVRIWDLQGREVRTFVAGKGELKALAFSADGKLIAVGGDDDNGAVTVWNIADGKRVARLVGHESRLTSICFLNQGEELLTSDRRGFVRRWSVARQTEMGKWRPHIGNIEGFVVLPDGKTIISACYFDGLKRWNIDAPDKAMPFGPKLEDFGAIALSPDGRTVAIGAKENIFLIDIEKEKGIGMLSGHTDRLNSLAFSPDGQKLASGGEDWSARIWDVQTKKLLHEVQKKTLVVNAGNQVAVNAVAFSADGATLAVGSKEVTLRLWDVKTGEERFVTPGHTSLVIAASWSPDGKTIASASHVDTTVRLWDASTGQEKKLLLGHRGAINHVKFASDGKHLASAGAYEDNSVILWNAAGQEVHRWRELGAHFYQVEFSPKGDLLAAHAGKGIRIWDVTTGNERARWDEASGRVVRFSSDGTELCTVQDAQDMLVWNIAKGEVTRRIPLAGRSVFSLALSPEGKAAAIGFYTYQAALWDLVAGKQQHELAGHEGSVHTVDWSPNGKWVATGGDDRIVRIWDAKSGKLRQEFHGHEGTIFGLSFAPDSQRVVSASSDNTLLIWKLKD